MIVKIRCKFDTIFLFKSHKNKYNTPRQLSPSPVLTNVDMCVISLSYFFLYMLQTSRSTVAEFCFVYFRQECGIGRCVFIGWQPFYIFVSTCCRPVEVLLPSFVLFTFVRNVELGGVCS